MGAVFVVIVIILFAVFMSPNRKKTISIQGQVLEVDKRRTEPLTNALTEAYNMKAALITLIVTFFVWHAITYLSEKKVEKDNVRERLEMKD